MIETQDENVETFVTSRALEEAYPEGQWLKHSHEESKANADEDFVHKSGKPSDYPELRLVQVLEDEHTEKGTVWYTIGWPSQELLTTGLNAEYSCLRVGSQY